MNKLTTVLVGSLLSFNAAQAASITTTLYTTDINATPIGTVEFKDTTYGMLISPNLIKIPAGLHGFHIHEVANCGDHGMSAGGHYDPMKTKSHKGPYDKGHLGDLPVLYVANDGTAKTPVLAPRLKTKDLIGKTLMVHAGGDNYSDTPALGGGGAREACGVIK